MESKLYRANPWSVRNGFMLAHSLRLVGAVAQGTRGNAPRELLCGSPKEIWERSIYGSECDLLSDNVPCPVVTQTEHPLLMMWTRRWSGVRLVPSRLTPDQRI